MRTAVVELFGLECNGRGRCDKVDAATMAALGLHWLGYLSPTCPLRMRVLDSVQ